MKVLPGNGLRNISARRNYLGLSVSTFNAKSF